tara:strand:+ start:767 stop:3739 length:2973 start_codon:yes stop_codon:yes gene_type:complete
VPAPKQFVRTIFCLAVIFWIYSQLTVSGQVRVPFQERASSSNPSRKTFNIKGDFQLIGNTNLSLANYADDLMNDNLLLFEDVDDHPNTINSSSAVLNFPEENGADASCTNVLFAGLYWSGRGPTEDEFYVNDQNGFPKKLDRMEVKLFGPNDPVGGKFRAGENDIRYTYGLDLDNDLGLYVGFVEVTDYVRQYGEGEYTVADLGALEGTNYHYGGWSMVVVYENPVMENRSITVFDGYAFVRGSVVADFTIPISGFSAVDAGPVNMKLGIAAGEGDVAALGDYFEIERGVNTNDFVRLSHAGNSPDNFFNSSIYTGGNPRNPNLKNNTGMDISVFDVPNAANNIIANGQTSTRFRYGTDGDAYVIYNIIMAVDANEPEVQGYHYVNTINSQAFEESKSIVPGDELEIVVEVKNTGGVDLEELLLEINLPEGLEYVSSVGEYFFANNSGKQPSLKSDQVVWALGEIPLPGNPDDLMAKLTYTVRVTETCEILIDTCSANFVLDGQLQGINGNSGKPIPTTPLLVGFSEDSQCFNSPIFGPIDLQVDADEFLNKNCGYESGESKIIICIGQGDTEIIPSFYLPDFFPAGTRYYNEFPLTSTTKEYGGGINFPLDYEAIYYAVIPDRSCPIGFGFAVSEVEVEVEIDEGACAQSTLERNVSLSISKGVPPYSIIWEEGGTPTTETERAILPGLHRISVIDQTGCAARKEFIVPEAKLFTVEVSKNSSIESCPDQSEFNIQLVINSDSPSKYKVTISGELLSGESIELIDLELTEGMYAYDELLPGVYTVEIENREGCSQVESFEIEEEDLNFLKADFDYSSESLVNEGLLNFNYPISFENLSQGNSSLSYSWDFGDGNTSSEKDPIHQYSIPGNYSVSMEVRDLLGCVKEISKSLKVTGVQYIRMPDAFTPNGDGRNDYYYPVFNQLQTLEIWIFNRWGEIVFYSKSLEAQGWDGNFKGKEAPTGTYVYKVQYRNESDAKTLKNLSGSFLLIK